MFGFRKHTPDRESLMERLRNLEKFLDKLDHTSEVKQNILEEIDKIKSILSGIE